MRLLFDKKGMWVPMHRLFGCLWWVPYYESGRKVMFNDYRKAANYAKSKHDESKP